MLGPYTFALLGTATVGKSALVCRHLFGSYREDYLPTYEDRYSSSRVVDQIESEYELRDTPGSEEAFYKLFIEGQVAKQQQ